MNNQDTRYNNQLITKYSIFKLGYWKLITGYFLVIVSWLLVIAGPSLAQYEAPDPSTNTPNGRALGLGRAGVGLADDTAAIFQNPAGLGRQENWQFTTMSGQFLDEFSYQSVSGYYPTNFGTFGLGYMGSSIGGAFSTMKDPNSSDSDPIYIIDPSKPPVSYTNDVTILSYGSILSRFLKRFGWEKQIYLGASAKLFTSGLTGDDITQGSASGTELDLGAIYDTNLPWLTLGATVQNALPASMGGKLHYESGHDESYPAVGKIGSVFRLIGKSNSIRSFGAQDLKLLADYDWYPTLSGLPPTLHLGAEYSPLPLLSVRAGIDQDILGNGTGTGITTTSNLTGGIGLNFGGFRFDYAYQQFALATGTSSNYISLSYSPPVKEEQKYAERVVFTSPRDKLITFEAQVPVRGQVIDTGIVGFTIKGLAPKMDLAGNFDYSAALVIGKNSLEAVGRDRSNKPNYQQIFRVLRLQEFPDVPRDYWVAQPVSFLAMSNVITGYPDGTFKPEGNISRAEMCSLLMKSRVATGEGQGTPEAPAVVHQWHFKDISAKHWARQYIAQAAALGVVEGYPGDVFKPNGKITRAEGLAMITRFAGVPEASYEYEFPDVVHTHWAATIVAGAVQEGLLDYLAGKMFEPNRLLTRAEAVEMLRQTQYIKRLLAKGLLDWGSY